MNPLRGFENFLWREKGSFSLLLSGNHGSMNIASIVASAVISIWFFGRDRSPTTRRHVSKIFVRLDVLKCRSPLSGRIHSWGRPLHPDLQLIYPDRNSAVVPLSPPSSSLLSHYFPSKAAAAASIRDKRGEGGREGGLKGRLRWTAAAASAPSCNGKRE